MTLYNCKTEIDHEGSIHYRITKFSADLEVESSYRTTLTGCECPAGHRPSCRHREMLPAFLRQNATNGQQFHDFDRGTWLRAQAEVEQELPIKGPASPEHEAWADEALPPAPPMAEIPPEAIAEAQAYIDRNPSLAPRPFRRL